MENDNWRQAANKFTGGIQQIYQNPGVAGDNADDFNHTLPAIIISKDAHKNVDGVPYGSPLNYTHSSFLRTMQEIFGVGPWLGDAANANDLSDLFKPGSVPNERRIR